ncbi:MAG: hypothetical protein JJU36_15450 [Phycisphaeraceae bacterium]|nr:hypothetical protein [Phycisphaeraceae bacterium]
MAVHHRLLEPIRNLGQTLLARSEPVDALARAACSAGRFLLDASATGDPDIGEIPSWAFGGGISGSGISGGGGGKRPEESILAMMVLAEAVVRGERPKVVSERLGQAFDRLCLAVPSHGAFWKLRFELLTAAERRGGAVRVEPGRLPIDPGSGTSDPAPLRLLGDDESLDGWTYAELVGLHALAAIESSARRKEIGRIVDRAVAFHVANTQPDNTTCQPWAIHAFASRPEGCLFAEQQLHDAMLQFGSSGQETGSEGPWVPALILVDAWLSLSRQVR